MPTVIYNCKKCKIGKRVEYPLTIANVFYRIAADGIKPPAGIWINSIGRDGHPTEYGGDVEMGICPNCHKVMDYNQLKAFLKPEVKCSGICVHARGASCECSCGGANHGIGWS